MPSQIKVDQIAGASGNTVTVPSGQTLDISSATLSLPSTIVTTTGTQTLTNKTIGVSQLSGTLPVANGGTGLTTLGTANQVLRVNSGATALEFGTVSTGANAGEIIQVVNILLTTSYSFTSTSYSEVSTDFRISLTPASSSNKILILPSIMVSFAQGSPIPTYYKFKRKIGGGSFADFSEPTSAGSRLKGHWMQDNRDTGTGENAWHQNCIILDSPATTSEVTYALHGELRGSGTTYINRMGNDSDNNDQFRGISTITLLEVKG